MRVMLSAAAAVVFLVGTAMAQNQGQNTNTKQGTDQNAQTHQKNHVKKAKIVSIDPKKGTVTLQFKGKDGNAQTRKFHLTEDIEYADSTGRVAQIDLFRSGDEVLVVEEKGRLRNITKMAHHNKSGSGATGATPASGGTTNPPRK